MAAGAVLTGGASRRMGSDKALLEVDGVPMGTRVAEAMISARCEPVVFVGGEASSLAALGGRVVRDVAPGEGPVGGVMTALRALGGEADVVVIASCDLPFLTAAHLLPLIDRASNAVDVDVVVARSDRLQPLCAVWRTSALPAVEAAFETGERTMHRLLRRLRIAEMPVDVGAVRNINTLDDLDQ